MYSIKKIIKNSVAMPMFFHVYCSLVVGDQPQLIEAVVKKAATLVPGQGAGVVMGPVIDAGAKERILAYAFVFI